jgi:hypothetical protein
MGYEVAINKAWGELASFKEPRDTSVRFLADNFTIDYKSRAILSLSCNVAAKEFTSVLILHYLVQKAKGLPPLTGQWLNFRELSGIEGYYAAFRKRSLEPLIRKYGNNPSGIISCLERFPGKHAEGGDAAIVIETFSRVPMLVKVWGADEEFGADANIFFDASINHIFCTEDIVVLAQIVASQL